MDVNPGYKTARVVWNKRLGRYVIDAIDFEIPVPKTEEEKIKEEQEADECASNF